MTNQEKKEYLLGYQRLNQRINRLLLEQQHAQRGRRGRHARGDF